MSVSKHSLLHCTVFCTMASFLGCSMEGNTEEGAAQPASVEVTVSKPMTKSEDPDENVISDINLFTFSEDGILEDCRYVPWREMADKKAITVKIMLVRGVRARIACLANLGYRLDGIRTSSDLDNYRYSMAYPDEYSKGMPMFGSMERVWTPQEKEIRLNLKRMMAKISISMDRSELDAGVKLNVKSVTIGNCPKSATLKGPSSPSGENDVFSRGFIKSYEDVNALNKSEKESMSGEVDVYMLENMNGNLLDDTVDDNGKILSGTKAKTCSYIEIRSEYISPGRQSGPDGYLIYRFYLGESSSNFDVERNCHYHVTVQPHGSGLEETGWRIDKTGLEEE